VVFALYYIYSRKEGCYEMVHDVVGGVVFAGIGRIYL
jgi:hypothetical protein